eukprot:541943-Amphidinium_carterae.1
MISGECVLAMLMPMGMRCAEPPALPKQEYVSNLAATTSAPSLFKPMRLMTASSSTNLKHLGADT